MPCNRCTNLWADSVEVCEQTHFNGCLVILKNLIANLEDLHYFDIQKIHCRVRLDRSCCYRSQLCSNLTRTESWQQEYCWLK